jgi:hypothetical protein
LSFEIGDLLEAGEKYGPHLNKLEGIYPKLVWATRSVDPERRLDNAIEFLGKWRALRFRGGGDLVRRVYPEWVKANEMTLRKLEHRPLYALSSQDFYAIFYLAATLSERHLPPTTFGKLLHFLLPETVLLWDQEIVRDAYDLEGDPCSFVSYQCFGWRLLRHISRSAGISDLQMLEEKHAQFATYYEPATRILDHLAYYRTLAKRAVAALGGHEQAFRLELPMPT